MRRRPSPSWRPKLHSSVEYASSAYAARNWWVTLPNPCFTPHDLGVIDLAERTPRSEEVSADKFCAAVAQQNSGPYRLEFYATMHAVVCVVDDAEVKA